MKEKEKQTEKKKRNDETKLIYTHWRYLRTIPQSQAMKKGKNTVTTLGGGGGEDYSNGNNNYSVAVSLKRSIGIGRKAHVK